LKHFPKHLEQALSSGSSTEIVSTISGAFVSFDNAITNQVRSIFPDPEALASIPAEELSQKINDHESGGANYEKIILSMRGTTALVALVDDERKNMWVAGLGDCRASTSSSSELLSSSDTALVLGVKLPDDRWEARDLIAPHNGTNKKEMQKVRDAHPGEPAVTRDDRLLGAIAVTRGEYQ
jgi:pyruvate dehydrogenase phosphatase